VRNGKAALSVLFGLLALGALGAAVAAARYSTRVGLREAGAGIPLGLLFSVFAIRFGRQGAERHQRTLGRTGGRVPAAVGRALGAVALIVSVTAVLAVVVFAVLTLVLD
jgi:hypothetical protein